MAGFPDSRELFPGLFTGSPLWNLFGEEAEKLEGSWNRNAKVAFDLPFATHRYLVKHVVQCDHVKETLVKRFLSFIVQVKKSSKIMPQHILNTIQHDVRSTTGSNLRNILLLTPKDEVDTLEPSDYKYVNYHPIVEENMWKPNVIQELTNTKYNQLEVPGFSTEELDEILSYVSTS